MNDERALVARILGGDAAASETLVVRYRRLIAHIVHRLVPDESDREDMAQEVFMRVFRSLPRFSFESKLSTWAAQIAYNTCLNHMAKKKMPVLSDIEDDTRETVAVALGPGPDRIAEEADTASRLRSAIAALPVPYRTVITLYHLDEMSYEEMSQVMNLPINTVKSHLFRARKRLKSALAPVLESEDWS